VPGHGQDAGGTWVAATGGQAGAAAAAGPGPMGHECGNGSLLREDAVEKLLAVRRGSTPAERNSPSET